jgi:hypothetical protein
MAFRNFIALNVYLALCYYKLDYYDVSLVFFSLYNVTVFLGGNFKKFKFSPKIPYFFRLRPIFEGVGRKIPPTLHRFVLLPKHLM